MNSIRETVCGTLTSASQSMGFDRINGRWLVINVVIFSTINSSAAIFLGGASLGTAVVTVGLPACALTVLATLVNAISLKIFEKCNLINSTLETSSEASETSSEASNTPLQTVHIGILSLRNLVVVVVTASLGSLIPIFRINALFSLVMNQVPIFQHVAIHSGFQVPIDHPPTYLGDFFWMEGILPRV